MPPLYLSHPEQLPGFSIIGNDCGPVKVKIKFAKGLCVLSHVEEGPVQAIHKSAGEAAVTANL
jgi:hypothetical protein